MTQRHTRSTYTQERRLVMPELGSRYRPRAARPQQVVDGFLPSQQPAKLSSAPQTAGAVQTDRKQPAARPALPRQNRSMVLTRRITAKAAKHQKQARQARFQQVKAFALGTTIAGVVSLAGLSVYMQHAAQNQPPQNAPQTLAAVASNNGGLDESQITNEAVASHQVKSDEPRVLRILKTGVNARVQSVTAGHTGQPQPTANTHDVGWLSSSGKPGRGVMVINGHASGLSHPAVFAGLVSLVKGDVIQVERGDGTTFKYSVVRTQSYPSHALDMNAVHEPAEPGEPGLTLMTNIGRFNVRTNQFESRLVVWAVQQ